MKIGDILDQQAYFLELNVSNLDRRTDAAIIKKQEHQVKELRKLADQFRGELKDAVNKTDNEIKKEEKYLQTEVRKDDFQSSAVIM